MRNAMSEPTNRLTGTIAALAFLIPQIASAQPTGQEIATRSLQAFYYAAADMQARVSMTLVNPQERRRQRELTMLRLNTDTGGDQRYFMYFHGPEDVRGMTFMVWKSVDRDDDRWVFVPSVNLVRRIAASDKRSSFVGSDFTYEDISGRRVADETHELLRVDSLNGRPAFVLESRPLDASSYTRRESWIDTERWLPLMEEYFDARGQKVRVFTADEVTQVDGHWTVTRRTMNNLQTGHRTEVALTDVSYDVGLDNGLFTERYLRQPPRRWIR